MAWQRELMLPVGAVSSRTWRGRDESGRTALLREVPEGQTPTVSTSTVPGIVPLREVVVIDGRRFGVWDLVDAESLQDACERLADEGRALPLAVLVRIIVDAARHLVAVTPARPHGGLSDGSLLVRRDGAVLVMDFGAPRPGRFSPRGPPSFGNDVFALGAVLHAALTGFGGSYADAVDEGLSLPAPSQLHDECTPAIDDVIHRAIARAVEGRQPDLELLADELEAVLGDALATPQQVAEALRAAPRGAPPVPDDDPGPALGADEDIPTGRHELPGSRDTRQGLEPVAPIPMGTQPGTPPRDAFAEVGGPPPGPPPGIPMSTQPGVPGPALADAPPEATQPRAIIPKAMASRPSKPVAPAPVPVDTQPRLRVPETSENEVPSGATPTPSTREPAPADARPRPRPASRSENEAARGAPPVAPAAIPVDTQPRIRLAPRPEREEPTGATAAPAPVMPGTAASHAKLEWAATQTRVPTPPVGVPALGDDEPEPTNVKPRPPAPAPASTSGTAPVLDSVPSLETTAASGGDLPKPGGGAPRAVIAVLLVIVAGLFGALAWKKQSGGDVEVEQVVLGDDDAGTPAVVTPQGPVDDGGADAGVEAVASEGDDAGADEDDEDADGGLEEGDGGADAEAELGDAGPDDAGASDAGAKKAAKKKPTKKKRRR